MFQSVIKCLCKREPPAGFISPALLHPTGCRPASLRAASSIWGGGAGFTGGIPFRCDYTMVGRAWWFYLASQNFSPPGAGGACGAAR